MWIQFIDADDFVEPDMLEKMYALSNGVDMVSCGFIRGKDLDQKKEYIYTANLCLRDKKDTAQYLQTMTIYDKDLLLNYVWNKWFKREILENKEISFREDIRLGEDYLFVCEYLKYVASIRFSKDCMYHYCYHTSGSLVGRFDINESERRTIMREALKQLFDAYEIIGDGRKQILLIEGKYCLISLSKYKGKLLPKEKCLRYINSFISDSEHRQCMLYYLKKNRNFKNLIKYLVIYTKNSKAFYALCR